MTKKPRVHVIFTGGTISMRIDPETGAAVPAMSGSEILSRVPGIRRQARLSFEDYARLPGPHVTPPWMWRLKNHVADLLSDPEIDGIVITHGTDTMEETAFLHQLTLGDVRPIVFCGAMRTVSEAGWDGPANLLAAVRAAAHHDSRGRGVMITVGEELHSAADASKWHTQRVNAFNSPNGTIGFIERDQIIFHRPPTRDEPLVSRRLVADVDLHVMASGLDGGLIRSSIARGVRGLVIEATGVGNVPPQVVPAIRKAISKRIAVVAVSRCPEGAVAPAYGYEGGGQKLGELGVIFGGELPGHKARIKLMVALGVTSDRTELRRIFSNTSASS